MKVISLLVISLFARILKQWSSHRQLFIQYNYKSFCDNALIWQLIKLLKKGKNAIHLYGQRSYGILIEWEKTQRLKLFKQLTFRRYFVMTMQESRRDWFVFFAQYCKQNDLRVKRLYDILGGICRYAIFVIHNLSSVKHFVWIRSFEGKGTVRRILLVLKQPWRTTLHPCHWCKWIITFYK